ncbi:hypothetical protein JIN84_09400 [Luteolibacter yonseiensis]|uniref:Uncharacterized protein n=1 Tax=Luteolibacter yonseiensis TaxID=1144680 RepID=A0A934R2X2_9BACT|nr:hypothetical protein [Luteolibacter yonseiensis]MBK1815832.1 hypothetical protein [Luteolibacter yonseiensis]
MNRHLLIIVCSFAGIMPLAGLERGPEKTPVHSAADLPVRIEEEIFQLNPPSSGFGWLPREYGSAAIQYLLQKSRDPRREVRIRAKATLIGLRHQQTIDEVIGDYSREDETASEIMKEVQGYGDLLKPLIPIFDTASTAPRKNRNQQEIPAFKSHVGNVILYCLMNDEGFPKETRDWAGALWVETSKSYEGPEFHPIWLLRNFLEHNKQALTSGNHAGAVWLPTFEGEIDKYQPSLRERPSYASFIATNRDSVMEGRRVDPTDKSPQKETTRPVLRPDIQSAGIHDGPGPGIPAWGWIAILAGACAMPALWLAKRAK